MRVNILTSGFASPNGAAFLMPLILHRRELLDAGIDVRIYYKRNPAVTECDVLLLDSKYHDPRWARESESVLEEIAGLTQQAGCLIYMDILDSTGWDHARALPHVTLYCKSQLLRDRSAYLKPHYGHRAFTDHYHRHMGVVDETPVYSEPVEKPQLLEKLTVSWNSGLADYSWLGPYRMRAYHHLAFPPLLRFPLHFFPPSAARAKDLSCRIGTSYIRDSVRFQRQRLAAILEDRMETDRISKRDYLAELRDSKIAVSPFGYGEIAYRDFEIFMCGALLLKPDMSGVDTWPDLYRDQETMVAHRWDLSDVEEKIDMILSDYEKYLDLAIEGQNTYRRHLSGQNAGRLFAEHLTGILAKAVRLSSQP